ncbi:MAG: flagellin [Phycisphaerae bacterium]
MLAIKNNLMAEQAARQLGKQYDKLHTAVGHLSSGERINDAGDDAAGLAVRELIRADVTMLRQGSRNARDAISMLQTAEGAMSVIDDILIRMMGLSEQAATDSYSDDQREIMDQEFQQLIHEIDRIANNTDFNGQKLIDDETETFNIHIGSAETIDIGTHDMTAAGLQIGGKKSYAIMNSAGWVSSINDTVHVSTDGTLLISFTADSGQQTIRVDLSSGDYTLSELVETINEVSRATDGEEYDVTTIHYDAETQKYGLKFQALWGASDNTMVLNWSSAGVGGVAASGNWSATAGTGTKISIADNVSATGALNTIWAAIKTKDEFRAKMGYLMNRLESAISVVDIEAENLLAAESRISDVDVAVEMAAMTRYQVLAQAGISMLGQANTMPQMALSLLQG